MASILSFDSGSMSYLLDDQFDEYFSDEFPIFYKNKIQKGKNVPFDEIESYHISNKYFYRSAIDNALRNGQVRAVVLMIDYIVKYQNNYSSSFLFEKNLPVIFALDGIQVGKLLSSRVFKMEIKCDEWPQIHTNDKSYLRPYNGSLFTVHENYKTCFPEKEFEKLNDDGALNSSSNDSSALASLMNMMSFSKVDKSKIFKIKYDLNLIPQIGSYIRVRGGVNEYINENTSIMKLCTESNEFEIFNSPTINDYIQFKWQTFGKRFHSVGSAAHLMYVVVLIMYNSSVYIQNVINYREDLSHMSTAQKTQYK